MYDGEAVLPRKGEVTFSERGRRVAEMLAGRSLTVTWAELKPFVAHV